MEGTVDCGLWTADCSLQCNGKNQFLLKGQPQAYIYKIHGID